MRSLLLVAAVLTAAPALAEPIQPGKCRDENARAAATRVARPQRLGEMPPATQLKAVRNLVDGCSNPVVVRTDVGTMSQRR